MDKWMGDEYLESLKAVTAAATPGPWYVGLEIDGPLADCPVVVREPGLNRRRIVTVDSTRVHVLGDDSRAAVANVAFIAVSRDAVPWLLAENRYLRNLLNLSLIGDGDDATE